MLLDERFFFPQYYCQWHSRYWFESSLTIYHEVHTQHHRDSIIVIEKFEWRCWLRFLGGNCHAITGGNCLESIMVHLCGSFSMNRALRAGLGVGLLSNVTREITGFISHYFFLLALYWQIYATQDEALEVLRNRIRNVCRKSFLIFNALAWRETVYILNTY